jgi:5'-nucleotidase
VLAAETFNTDLIIGGHTHTYLEKPEEMINKAGKKVIINQASWGGLVLGKIDFMFEAGKKNPEIVTIQNIELKNEA